VNGSPVENKNITPRFQGNPAFTLS